jgi:hypothetical protein
MERFKELFKSLNGLLPQAIFRAKLNPMAAEPLAMFPNKPEHEFSNAQFQHCLCGRLPHRRCSPPLLLSACSVAIARESVPLVTATAATVSPKILEGEIQCPFSSHHAGHPNPHVRISWPVRPKGTQTLSAW